MEVLLLKLGVLLEPYAVFSISGSNGEYAFFRAHDVALLAIPRRILSPDLKTHSCTSSWGAAGGRRSKPSAAPYHRAEWAS